MQNDESKDSLMNENDPGEITQETPEQASEADNLESLISEDEIEGLGKEQLAAKLEEFLEMDDTQSIFHLARLVKSKWDERVKEEYDRKLSIFIQDGTPPEDFEPKEDPRDKQTQQTWKKLNSKKISQRKQKEKSEKENLSTKRMIIEELKELLKGKEGFSSSYNKFQALQTKWRTTGSVPPHEHQTLKENYFFLTGKFYDMVKINNELRALDQKKNDELKIQLCEKAELLNNEPSIRKSSEGLRQIQKEWSEIRNSSRELKDDLWKRFKTATDIIVEKRKEHILKLKQLQESNLEAKSALCQRMEDLSSIELTSHKICREASEKENTIWEEWQKIGFVPKSDNGNCWKRFKNARRNFHQVLDVFYAKQRSEFSANLNRKGDLCLRAEQLMESKEWQSTAELFKKLQAEWKTIGPVSQKDSNAIWMRFRKACDHFFEAKANFHAEKENLLKANIQAREAIISKANLFEPPPDINKSLEELKKIQEEWAGAGEIPPRESERLNNNFGKSVEKLLGRIKSNSQVDDKLFLRLKYAQMLKSPQGIEQIKAERAAVKDKIRKLQAEVLQLDNNLSFFGKSKNPNPVIDGYRERLEKAKQETEELNTRLKFIPKV